MSTKLYRSALRSEYNTAELHYMSQDVTGRPARIDDSLAAVRSRIASRVNLAMDRMGYPLQTVDRRRQLAAALGWDLSACNTLLSGKTSPSIEQLVAIAAVLQQELTFFLDASAEPLPAGTVRVPPLTFGEMLVLRLPSEDLSLDEARRGLVYYYASGNMGFGIHPGEALVALTRAQLNEAQVGALYLFSEDDGFKVRQCTDANQGRAVFRAEGSVPRIVGPGDASTTFVYGKIIARLRFGRSAHPDAASGVAK